MYATSEVNYEDVWGIVGPLQEKSQLLWMDPDRQQTCTFMVYVLTIEH